MENSNNAILAESILNPSGVLDTCSHIIVVQNNDLIISDCMPYSSTYTFQFWIKAKNREDVIFACENTTRKIKVTTEWQYFYVTFDIEEISNIKLTFPTGEYWIYNTKLEIGSYPTDWSPHPEDGNLITAELSEKVERLISQTTSTINNITQMTDKINMTIENSLTRTEFQTNINGIVNNINENIDKLQDGIGKWHVSVYNKSDFEKLTQMPQTETDWSDIDSLTHALQHQSNDNNDSEDNVDENNNINNNNNDTPSQDPSHQDPDYESPIDDYDGSEEEIIDDRERYDIKIFSMQNGDINPIEEMMVNDDPISMRLNGKDKIFYYYTFAKFSKDISKPLSCSFKKASCYLNGVMLVSDKITDTMDITFDFKLGWNLIEIVSNEGNFSFNQSISNLPECLMMNCLVASPTSRSVKTRIKSSGIYQSLERILSEVYEYEDEIYMSDGVAKKRKVLKGSRIKQTADLISLMVKNIYGDYSQLDINPTFIQAITQKFEIVDQRTGRKVIVKDGKLQANSIDTYMLSTNALASRNYDGGTLTERYVVDDQTGETTIIAEADINFDPENNIIFPEHGTFYDLYSGNIYSPSFVLINDYHKSLDEDEDGEFDRIIDVHNKAYFKGTIYATNSQFSGSVISREGEIGPWHITADSIYKGNHQLGAKGFGNAYLGDAGMSLGNSFIYNSQTGNLDLRVNSLQITGPDAYQLVSQAINGNTIYYTYGVPNLTNAPSNAWNAGEYSIHINELCYDINTGKLYRFEKKRNNYTSDDEVNSTLYVITFDTDSALRSGAIDYIDYVEIFYEYNKKTYKVATTLASNNSFNLPIVIPTDSFYVYLHITESETIVDYYGFAIDSVTPTTGNATPTVEISNNQTVHKITAEDIINSGNVTVALNTSNLPNYPIDRSLEIGEFPETEHPYIHAETDIVWYVRSGVGSLQSYQWVEIENAELTEAAENARKALTFMYYDPTNGFILHNGLHLLPDGLVQDDIDEIEGGNVRLTSGGVDFYNGNTKLAEYGANTIFYGLNSNNQMVQKLFIGQDGIAVKDGVFMLGWNDVINDYLFKIYDNGNFLFGDDSGLTTSPTNNNYIKWDNQTGRFTISADAVSIGKQDVAQSISTVGSELKEFQSLYKAMMESISKQADGVAQTFSSNTDPSINWITANDKSSHVGDIWENTNNNKYYIYVYSEPSNNYKWMEVDNLPIEYKNAVNRGAKAFVTEINQSTGESNLPQPPYKEGDLWLNATFTYLGHEYDNEIMVCCNSKALGQTASGGDWVLASKYTGDDKAIEVEKELEHHKNWYGSGIPTMSNYPVNTWLSSEYDNYIGSQYTDNSTGKTYRFYKNNNVYNWAEIQDIDIPASALVAKNFSIQTSKWGLVISNHKLDDDTDIEALTDYNIRLNSNGMNVYYGQNILASYGSVTNFYIPGTTNVAATVGANGFSITDGLAGGIHITNDAIYGASHSQIGDNDSGFYLGSNGSFEVGNSTNYLRFQNGTLTMMFGGSDLSTQLSTINTNATNAEKTATNYLVVDSYGLNIYNDTSNTSNKPHVLLDANSLNICLGNYILAEYGSTARFYKPNSYQIGSSLSESCLEISSNGVNISTGSINLGQTNDSNHPYHFSVNNDGSLFVGDSSNYLNFQNGTLTILLSGNSLSTTLSNLQTQIDGRIQTWSQASTNDPSTTWNTTALKDAHVGDIWYKTDTKTFNIYTKSGNTYSWSEMAEDAVSDEVMEIVNRKSSIFTSQPTTPYYVGDLWVNVTGTVNNVSYTNDILRCTTTRTTGNFTASDWQKASGYTDDSTFNTFYSGTYATDKQTLDTKADNAGKTATNYLNYTANGLIISTDATTSNPYINLSSTGLDIYGKYNNSIKKLATYGATTKFYGYDSSGVQFDAATINSNGFNINNGTLYCSKPWTTFDNKDLNAWIKIDGGVICIGRDNTYNTTLFDTVKSQHVLTFNSYLDGFDSYSNSFTDQIVGYNLNKSSSGTDYKVQTMVIDYEIGYFGAFQFYASRLRNGTLDYYKNTSLVPLTAKAFVVNPNTLYASNSTGDTFYVNYNGEVYSNGALLSSDIRKKNLICSNINSSYKHLFMNLNTISYTWKNGIDNNIHFGVSAQDVNNTSEKLGLDNLSLIKYDSSDGSYYANYTEILMLSVPVVQEHETEIQKLKSEIESLKGEIKKLKGR